MREHQLKTWTPHFDDVQSGRKSYELRSDDRHFEIGDVLELQEFEPGMGYTGRTCRKRVTHMLPASQAHQFGLRPGYVILGLGEAQPLTADFARALPGGALDDATFEAVESALDKIEAPAQAPGGRWLTLVERIATLQPLYEPTDAEVREGESLDSVSFVIRQGETAQQAFERAARAEIVRLRTLVNGKARANA